MNDLEATRIIQTALRTIEIIKGLQAGKKQVEIMRETGATKQVVNYYAKVLGLINQND